MPNNKPVRIGNAQAFWGDRTDAAAEMLALEPDLDYLTLDYLAEVSMSILAAQRVQDPQAGFARDFIDVVRSLVPYWSSGGRCRLIANAGGLNPRACAAVCRQALASAGCRSMRIGVVTGDDVVETLRAAAASLPLPLLLGEGRGEGVLSSLGKTPNPLPKADGFSNLDTGAPITQVRDRLVTANVYLGAAPIVSALAAGAEIVITGRVADPTLAVAPCMHHFGWTESDLDRLAGATVAGHLIECGTQVTGGISTDWLDVPQPANIGFPIVEVSEDGSCILTKPRGTGGHVTAATVKEQLLYEIGDPENYLSSDVTVSFLSLAVDDLGNDRVRVSGAVGKPRPAKYKVSATFHDGFRSAGTLTIIGRNSAEKARRVGEQVLQRVRDAGFTLRDSVVECLGSRAVRDKALPPRPGEFDETVLRVAVESTSRDAVERFASELIPHITSGPQGTTGYAEGRPRVQPQIRYWPCLIARHVVEPHVETHSSADSAKIKPPVAAHDARHDSSAARRTQPERTPAVTSGGVGRPLHLYDIAIARSGDKGTSANIGVIARDGKWWDFLRTWLTTNEVAAYLAPSGIDSVDRYELPNLGALNFVIHGILRQSLRIDAQGKALGQLLLEMPLPDDAMDTITQSRTEP